MSRVLILGAGVMGSTFGQTLVDGGNVVYLVGTHLDREIIGSIRCHGRHPRLNVKLPDEIQCFTHEQLGDALNQKPDLIVLGVSSAGVKWAVEQLGRSMKTPVPVLMLTKGLAVAEDSLRILPDVVETGLAGFGLTGVPVGAVAGPCIAAELAARRSSSVVIAHDQRAFLDLVTAMLDTPYYHVRRCSDLLGVEICAALKNYYALAVGYPAGLVEREAAASDGTMMHNAAAGLFTQALAEMAYIVRYMGGNVRTVYGLAGAGDLYVTCQSGRNSRMGRLLGKGLRYSEAKAVHMPDDTVEGAELALAIGPLLERLVASNELERSVLPLTAAIYQSICHDKPLITEWEAFYRETSD